MIPARAFSLIAALLVLAPALLTPAAPAPADTLTTLAAQTPADSLATLATQAPADSLATLATQAPVAPPGSSAALEAAPAPATTVRTESIPDGPLLSFVYDSRPHTFVLGVSGQRLLALRGAIRNDFDHPISHVILRGALKSADGRVLNERRAPAGHLIPDADLKTLHMTQILARLSLTDGTDRSNVAVPPGATVPFTLVFDVIPPQMVEYVIDPVFWKRAD